LKSLTSSCPIFLRMRAIRLASSQTSNANGSYERHS
jgi:hypothetical protein